MNKCVICNNNVDINAYTKTYEVTCQQCGQYKITNEAVSVIKFHLYPENISNTRKIANISGWLRENPNSKITQDDISRLSNIPTPSIAKRAEIFLRWLLKKAENLNDWVPWGFEKTTLIGLTYSINWHDVQYIAEKYLYQEKQFIKIQRTDGILSSIITPKGYAYLESLNINTDSQIGFCAMWFDESMTPTWTDAIQPAILSAGYEPKRIDQHEHTEGVMDEIISLIRQSRFVIADFTGERGGVYYEAGFAKGLGIRVIYTCCEEDFNKRHFDVQHYNFLIWQRDNHADFTKRLANRIEATIGKGNYRPDQLI